MNSPGKIVATVVAGQGDAIRYAAALEYGAPSRNIVPRLYLGRAVMKVKDETANPALLDALNVAVAQVQSKMIGSGGI